MHKTSSKKYPKNYKILSRKKLVKYTKTNHLYRMGKYIYFLNKFVSTQKQDMQKLRRGKQAKNNIWNPIIPSPESTTTNTSLHALPDFFLSICFSIYILFFGNQIFLINILKRKSGEFQPLHFSKFYFIWHLDYFQISLTPKIPLQLTYPSQYPIQDHALYRIVCLLSLFEYSTSLFLWYWFTECRRTHLLTGSLQCLLVDY